MISRRLYGALAPAYAWLVRRLGVWRRYMEQALPHLPPTGTIVEVGPGPGHLLRCMAGQNRLVLGLERYGGMLAQARRTIQGIQGVGQRVWLVQADATSMPLQSNAADAVVMTFALSAVADAVGLLAEARRVLCVGGVVVIVDSGPPDDRNVIGVALAWLWSCVGSTPRDERRLLAECGLELLERFEFGVANTIRLVVARRAGDGSHHGEEDAA